MILLPVNPMGAPRMTRADAWKQRPCVLRYRAFCDSVRLLMGTREFPKGGAHVTFWFPMPDSWSKKKRAAMERQPHEQKPDVDNCLKGLLDALFGDDACVWDVRVSKRWRTGDGAIQIQELTP